MRRLLPFLVVFVVRWTVTSTASHPCTESKVSEYTGEVTTQGWDTLCTNAVDKPMSKEFDTHDQAQLFIDNAPKDTATSHLHDWSIEEVNE